MDDPSIEFIDDDADVEVLELTHLGQNLINMILNYEPIQKVKHLIEDEDAPVWFQDDEGTSPLHAAAYVEDKELVGWLLAKGAVWNAVDNLGNTAGDVSLSLNDAESYALIRDAGIRSEYMLQMLSSHLDKDTDEAHSRTGQVASGSTLLLRATDSTAAGSTSAFLASKLRFTVDKHGQDVCLVRVGDGQDAEEVGVMMGWERGIMQETVRLLCDDHPNAGEGLRVLNVGFGLGIIDTYFQSLPTPPAHHVIIEPHPDVLAHMRSRGWYDKAGVTVLEGRWQDFVNSGSEVILGGGGFDVVYTDTFSEGYEELKLFFDCLPDLLAGPESRFSFFHGLGATNTLFYDVYTRLSEMQLSDVGLSTTWTTVDVDVAGDDGRERWGETRRYFGQRVYFLPVCRMVLA